ncbi:phosphoethanolamine--lipid A transferase EptA [Rhizosphaericola mali]|uniref:Phosphoethanolamine--lipid A transferase EptA n=1 Tax=Rhizosphaericola mali TaxID=2545455 RepID=A0A5P2G230_9BACT|nr:phosphoethanolamine--lipid A transferase EptA [Rhizosphaericola mali]QES88149.1 phosphoethanolamine--lipid A transferase EptA [Rhizosphaericola mali]
MFKFKNDFSVTRFAIILSVINFFLYHLPFFSFVRKNVDAATFGGIIIILSLIVIMLAANFFAFYLVFFLSRIAGKILIPIFFILNASCVYFVNTYSVIIDESMIGNVLNTNYAESSSFFSFKLILYILFLGLLPAILVIKAKIRKEKPKTFFIRASITLLFLVVVAFLNAKNWTWIDKHSKQLGGLAMPWSYTVNITLFYVHKHQKNEKEILLPNASLKDNKKEIFILVIGESARRANFSLYGYKKNTNPYLSKTTNLHWFDATSSATYTTAGVKAILEDRESSDLYEILPNYLNRSGVEVIWRTTNWGEPPVHIKNYLNKEALEKECKGPDCSYDEVLLTGLKEQILASTKNKIFIVLHTSTSHGPTYSKKYPPQFENFKPVCNSVELGECSKEELINAYDNTIVYTDFILHKVIEDLSQLTEYKSTMFFVSDHGESLGENNLYMHGMPKSIAPKEQYEIPFIVWTSDNSEQLKQKIDLTQANVFHSVLYFLGIQSPIYNEELNIFKN